MAEVVVLTVVSLAENHPIEGPIEDNIHLDGRSLGAHCEEV